MKSIAKYLSSGLVAIMLISAAAGILFIASSCQEEIGPPVIINVRTPDPATADSSVIKAFPGDYIVIQGENFEGLTKVYLNDYEAYFNPIYVTNTNIILQIPSAIPLKGADPTVTNEIRVVTPQGEATFSFKFLSPQPVISFLFFDVPASTDTLIKIYGNNFYEVLRVVFNVKGVEFEVQEYHITNYRIIDFPLPEGAQYEGRVMVITESGSDTMDFIPNPPPVITGVSRDLPVIGDTFTIYGRDFRNLDKVIFPGGLEVNKSQFTVNDLKTEILLTMPDVPNSGDLKVVRGDIEVVYHKFNDRSLVLYDYDEIGAWVWHGDDRDTVKVGEEPSTGNGSFFRLASNCPSNGGWYDEGANGVAITAWPAAIPSSTPIEKLAIALSVNTMMPWNDGYIEIEFYDDYYYYRLQPYLNSEVPVNKWISYLIPLKNFTNMKYITYADIKALDVNTTLRILINGNSYVPFDYDLCWDDLRFVIIQ